MEQSKSKLVLYTAAAATFLAGLAFSGVVIAVVHWLRDFAYPAYFLVSMLVSGFFLLLPSTAGETGRPSLWDKNSRKLRSGFWETVRRRGSWPLVILATVVLGPVGAGVSCRLAGLSGHRAWVHCLAGNLIATAIWVTVYLGAGHYLIFWR